MRTRLPKIAILSARRIRLVFLASLFGLASVSSAQDAVTDTPASGTVRIFSAGFLAGPTSGLGFKMLIQEPGLDAPGRSVDLSLSFNGQGFVQTGIHSLQERALPDTPLRLVIGPGMIAELDDGSVDWGLSATVGGYFLRGPYEVLFQLMPRFMIVPERSGTFGAAVGLRYRF